MTVLILLLLLSPSTSLAQKATWKIPAARPTTTDAPDLDPINQSPESDVPDGGQNVTPLLVPIPFKNTQVGWGLGVMAGLIHRFDRDTTTKPSTGAVMGFYTENDSWGLMAMEMARLGGDAWRLRGLVSHMDVNYKFYGIGQDAGTAGRSIDLNQDMDFSVASALGRVRPGLYLGPAVMWMRSGVELRDPPDPGLPAPPDDLPKTSLVAPGAQAQLDTRNDDYWPSSGTVAKLKTWFFASGLGSSRDFQRYFAAWSRYARLGDRPVIVAMNATGAFATGDVPFYMLPSIGAGENALRGYTQGRYRDHVAITLQSEARYHSEGRFGATAFAGFGQVAPEVSDLTKALVLPAGGAGLRWQLTRRYAMHVRLDMAWGRKESLLYFAVAEAF